MTDHCFLIGFDCCLWPRLWGGANLDELPEYSFPSPRDHDLNHHAMQWNFPPPFLSISVVGE